MTTKFIYSSDIQKDNTLKGQDKIIEICKKLGATEYFNPIGGGSLYNYNTFSDNGLELHFVNSMEIKYNQMQMDFISNLSIIDVLMFNDVKKVKFFLEQFKLK